MKARIQKWGNSLALRIPRPFATESKLGEGSAVDLSVRNGRIVVAPIAEPEFALQDLVAQIKPRNRHSEIETGGAVGNEVW
jgi:antitoxin MazE